tara:strand:- start:68 stop:349 length:282 start_codon:yes stop_codon:yes gene_type:complete
MIANPYHLKCENQNTNNQEKNIILIKKISLEDYLNNNYKDVYLSNYNIKCIDNMIHSYVNEIANLRIINSVLDNIINKVIENSDKFDFCLPFD